MRVKPILKYGLVAGALALPFAAHPLGLGKLTVESYVGQPLVARIELLSPNKEELDSLSAKIADPSLYSQNNLQYQGVLSRARIALERGPGDTAYLKVTSSTAVTEPYLDLLVDVNWASGRVVRDYTFLLDPPGAAATAVEPITPLRAGAAPAARPQSARPAAAAAAPSGQGDSYEVKRGDTLSKIAKDDGVQLPAQLEGSGGRGGVVHGSSFRGIDRAAHCSIALMLQFEDNPPDGSAHHPMPVFIRRIRQPPREPVPASEHTEFIR